MTRLVLGVSCATCVRRAPVMSVEEFQLTNRLSSDALRRIRHFTSLHGGGAPERQRERTEHRDRERLRAERLRAAGHHRRHGALVLPTKGGAVLMPIGVGADRPAGPCAVRPCLHRTPEREPFSGVCYQSLGERVCGRPWPCEAHPDEQATGEEQPVDDLARVAS